jgi:hypothetical protein
MSHRHARTYARGTRVRADDPALLRVLEANIETLQAENEILKRQLADAEARAGARNRESEQAIAEFPPLTERLTAGAANTTVGEWQKNALPGWTRTRSQKRWRGSRLKRRGISSGLPATWHDALDADVHRRVGLA